MSFIVNGADWTFDGLTLDQVKAKIEATLAFVRISNSRSEKLLIGDDFQSRPMLGELSLWQLNSTDSPIVLPGELFQELAAWLLQSPFYIDELEWPEGIDETLVSIGDDQAEDNLDIAWVHHTLLSGKAIACFSSQRQGRLSTRSSLGTAIVHFVSSEPERVAFWRDAIIIEGDDSASLQMMAPHAYPNVCFLLGSLGGVNRLDGGYLAIRGKVQSAFAALDDHGYWIFTCPPPAVTQADTIKPKASGTVTNQLIEMRFGSIGLDAAPEKANVRFDRTCREARERVVGGTTLYCEWHIKLEPHRNRIHIHGPISGSSDRVIVAIIDDHLPLP